MCKNSAVRDRDEERGRQLVQCVAESEVSLSIFSAKLATRLLNNTRLWRKNLANAIV